MGEPLLSVGIPTYNRAAKLARAIESVLAQTHTNLELIVRDDASSDVTETVCRRFAEHDPRVRYLRSATHDGPIESFNLLSAELRGEYVMVLAEDSWLDPDYLAACVAELERRADLALVSGHATFMSTGPLVGHPREAPVDQGSPIGRVLAYLRNPDGRSLCGGLMRAALLSDACPLRAVLGGRWLLFAAILAQAKATTVAGVAVHREFKPARTDLSMQAKALGLPRWQASVPRLAIAWELLQDVVWRAPAYRRLSLPARARLGCAGAFAVISWRGLAQDLRRSAATTIARRR
jgi:glycosyltransferase involved in cell wall biosynthesis